MTAKFKCVVRVVAVLPCQAEKLCSPSGTYRIRLTLEDPTARIHAFVVAEDGVRTNFIYTRHIRLNFCLIMLYYLLFCCPYSVAEPFLFL